jgi:hypothetical protein
MRMRMEVPIVVPDRDGEDVVDKLSVKGDKREAKQIEQNSIRS